MGDDSTLLGDHQPRALPDIASGWSPRFPARYFDLGEIGHGGMASVWRLRDQTLRRQVAVKLMDPALAGHAIARERFVNEAEITAQLDHPFIVPVYDLGVDADGNLFYVMKLVVGESLAERLERQRVAARLPDALDELLGIFLKVCDAIGFAHGRGVIHRDLKPANIMLGSYGQVYVMDWGLAQLSGAPAPAEIEISGDLAQRTHKGVSGTLAYMAPEQVASEVGPMDARTDVFALGAILYEILTGEPPHATRGETLNDLLTRVERCAIQPPQELCPSAQLPPALCRIAMTALARDPKDRYQSAVALQEAVSRFLRGAGRFATSRYAAGAVIVREGNPGDTAYVILSGRCAVYKGSGADRLLLRVMGPGEVFGEAAIFTGRLRSATVEALEDTTLQVVTEEMIKEGLGLNSWMGAFVFSLAERFREADAQLAALKHKRELPDEVPPELRSRGPR